MGKRVRETGDSMLGTSRRTMQREYSKLFPSTTIVLLTKADKARKQWQVKLPSYGWPAIQRQTILADSLLIFHHVFKFYYKFYNQCNVISFWGPMGPK